MYTTCFNIPRLCLLPTQCIFMFHTVLTINSEVFLRSMLTINLDQGVLWHWNLYLKGPASVAFTYFVCSMGIHMFNGTDSM
jgi:hypothetical protein